MNETERPDEAEKGISPGNNSRNTEAAAAAAGRLQPATAPASADVAPSAAAIPPSSAGRWAWPLAVAALILALIALGYLHFVVKPALEQKVEQLAAQVAPLPAALEKQRIALTSLERQIAAVGEQEAKIAALYEQMSTLTEAVAQSRERLAKNEAAIEQLKEIAQAAAEMTAALNRLGDRRWLVEAAETLTFAERQLVWNGNRDAAQAALELLAQRLASAERPLLRPLREAIEADLLAVRAAPRIDRDGVMAKLTALQQMLEEAPLAFSAPVAAERALPVTGELSWYERLWSAVVAFGRAVGQEWAHWLRLERLDASAPELLSPQQAQVLRVHLATWIAVAHLAVQKGDAVQYQTALAAIEAAVHRFFAKTESTRQAIDQTLAELKAAPVSAKQLTLSRSLAVLVELENRLNASTAVTP